MEGAGHVGSGKNGVGFVLWGGEGAKQRELSRTLSFLFVMIFTHLEGLLVSVHWLLIKSFLMESHRPEGSPPKNSSDESGLRSSQLGLEPNEV